MRCRSSRRCPEAESDRRSRAASRRRAKVREMTIPANEVSCRSSARPRWRPHAPLRAHRPARCHRPGGRLRRQARSRAAARRRLALAAHAAGRPGGGLHRALRRARVARHPVRAAARRSAALARSAARGRVVVAAPGARVRIPLHPVLEQPGRRGRGARHADRQRGLPHARRLRAGLRHRRAAAGRAAPAGDGLDPRRRQHHRPLQRVRRRPPGQHRERGGGDGELPPRTLRLVPAPGAGRGA